MQIKRFEAKDMQEALRKVKEAMGPEAILLSTKTIKPPFPGLKNYPGAGIEVVAAIDRKEDPSPGPIPPSFQPFPNRSGGRDTADGKEEEEKIIQRIQSIGLSSEFVSRLTTEVQTLRKELRGWTLPETYRGLLRWKLIEQIDVTGPSPDGAKIWSFIGPTGVGKTTTLVKLAAHFGVKVTSKITLITIDTYRIGAVEQLRTYAQILRMPLEIALHREDLKQIIERNRHQDLLLIDTAGRSPNHPNSLEELRDFLTVHPRIENHLLLSATTKDSDLERTARLFSSLLPIKSYIFTKIDETDAYASLFNELHRSKRPLSYLTTGQRVPEDIELATKVRMANLVLSQIQWNSWSACNGPS